MKRREFIAPIGAGLGNFLRVVCGLSLAAEIVSRTH
jgi:hypothetical protein